LCANLFSIIKAIKNGFNPSNKDTSICLTKGSASMIFDRVINIMSGTISGIEMIGNESPVLAQSNLSLVSAKNINKFHEMIRQCRTDRLKKSATMHGLMLKSELKVCEDCTTSKFKIFW
jgi:hypothetical protein